MTTYSSPTKFSDAPEVARYDDGLEAHRPEKYNAPIDANLGEGHFQQTQPSTPRTRTICGLRRTTFFLSLGLGAVVVLAAAIGGGVGASACSGGNSNRNVAGNGVGYGALTTEMMVKLIDRPATRPL
jgi:hypothetical protein